MIDIKSLLNGLPETIRYVVVIGFVLVLMYVCLILTRVIGSKLGGDKIYFDDPEAYDESIPSLFGSTYLMGKKKKKKKEEEPEQAPQSKDE